MPLFNPCTACFVCFKHRIILFYSILLHFSCTTYKRLQTWRDTAPDEPWHLIMPVPSSRHLWAVNNWRDGKLALNSLSLKAGVCVYWPFISVWVSKSGVNSTNGIQAQFSTFSTKARSLNRLCQARRARAKLYTSVCDFFVQLASVSAN